MRPGTAKIEHASLPFSSGSVHFRTLRLQARSRVAEFDSIRGPSIHYPSQSRGTIKRNRTSTSNVRLPPKKSRYFRGTLIKFPLKSRFRSVSRSRETMPGLRGFGAIHSDPRRVQYYFCR